MFLWQHAKDECRQIGFGAHLLSIESAEEFRNVYFNLTSKFNKKFNFNFKHYFMSTYSPQVIRSFNVLPNII